MIWLAFGIYIGIAIGVVHDKYEQDTYTFPEAAARGLIWPIVFVARIVCVTHKTLREVWK